MSNVDVQKDVATCAKRLLEVCARWYDVAVDNAAMWSRFDLSNMSDHESRTFFHRSCGYKKRIAYISEDLDAPSPTIIQLLAQHMDSVKELDFQLEHPTFFLSWLNHGCPSAPALHTLSLGRSCNGSICDISAFKGKAPNLRHLALTGSPKVWKAESYRNLTILRITGIPMNAHLCHEGIFGVLRGSPFLQELGISIQGRSTWGNSGALSRPIRNRDDDDKLALRSLFSLRLCLPHALLFYILRALGIPKSPQVLEIAITDAADGDPYDTTIPSQLLLPGILPPSILAGTRSVHLNMPHGPDAHGFDSIRLTGDRCGNHFEVQLSWEKRSARAYEAVLQALIEHHPLPSAQSLDLVALGCDHEAYGDRIPLNLPRFVAHLGSITSLQINATHHGYTRLLPRICRFQFPRLTTLNITIIPLRILSSFRTSWLPSFRANSPSLKHLDVTLEPLRARIGLTNQYYLCETDNTASSSYEVAAVRLSEELEAIFNTHPQMSIRSYMYYPDDNRGQPTPVWSV